MLERLPTKPYSNREIEEKWIDIANSLSRIEVQTTTTNGRVRKLEQWKFAGMGAVSVLSFLVVPILIWALSILVNMDQRIQQSVDRALSVYEITSTK